VQVGELFLKLGIKGADKTVGALKESKKGMSGLASTSLEAKAAIIAAFYAMQRLMAASGAVGTKLTNFNALWGVSTDTLQRYQYAARQAGISNDEMAKSISNVSAAMAQVDLNKGVPEGLFLISKAAGGIDFKKKNDPFYMHQMIGKALRNLGDDPRSKAIANYLVGTLGMSENVIAGFRRGKFNQSILNAAPIYSKGQLGSLDKNNIAWENMMQKIEMSFGKFFAEHGDSILKALGGLVDASISLTEVFVKMAEVLKLFDLVGGIGKALSGKEPTAAAKQRHYERLKSMGFNEEAERLYGLGKSSRKTPFYLDPNFSESKMPNFMKSITGPLGTGTGGTTNFYQNFYYQHDGRDSGRISDDHKRSAKEARERQNTQRQSPAQGLTK